MSPVDTAGERVVLRDESRDEPQVSAAPGAESLPPVSSKPGEVLPGSAGRSHAVTSASSTETVHRHGFLQAFQSLVYIIVIALFIITFTVQPFRIPSESMEPTLLVGDFLLVDKEVSSDQRGVMAPTNVVHRGDLIVFHYPVEPALHLVKRVVGLPGDRVRLRDGRVFINGEALAEPYAIFRPSAPDSYRDDFPRMSSVDSGVNPRWWSQLRSFVSNGELTVPAESYFVLGDNRNDSEDSRYWGFVPRSAIVGKPFLIYFSLRSLDNTPGQLPAGARGMQAEQPEVPLGSLMDFARWDRALRVIY